MKILNTIVTMIIILSIFASFFVENEIVTYKSSIPNYSLDAQAGIGPFIILVLWWSINSIFCLSFFIALLVTGIKRKELKNIHSIINFALLVFAFVLPIFILDY
jgi:hypothetical protein